MGFTGALLTGTLLAGEGARRNVIAAKDEADKQRKALQRQYQEMQRIKKTDLEALALLNQQRRSSSRGPRNPTMLTGGSGVLAAPLGGPKTLLGL